MIPLKLTKKLKITSGYGERIHPVSKKKTFHYGVDLTGGTEILATQNGKVVEVVNKGKNGGTMCKIRIQHKDYQSAYYHNKSGSAKVKKGDYVNIGDFIAITGDTGTATGVHLHFQIDKGSNKTSIDPTKYALGEENLKGLLDLKMGNYVVQSPRYVRKGAGTEYEIKKVYELTTDGQNHCVNKKKTAKAQYEKGTVFTVEEFRYARNGAIWALSPSGWVCVKSHKNTWYCTKR